MKKVPESKLFYLLVMLVQKYKNKDIFNPSDKDKGKKEGDDDK